MFKSIRLMVVKATGSSNQYSGICNKLITIFALPLASYIAKPNMVYFYINPYSGSILIRVTEIFLFFAGICKNCAI